MGQQTSVIEQVVYVVFTDPETGKTTLAFFKVVPQSQIQGNNRDF